MRKLSKRMTVSCGIVIVRQEADEYKYLLLRSRKYYDFPKGRMEAGEDPLDTALRETEEETTIAPDELKFTWGKDHKQSDTYKKGRKFVIYFLAETKKEKIELPVNEELGHPEHEEYEWMTFEDANKVLVPRVQKILRWAQKRIEN